MDTITRRKFLTATGAAAAVAAMPGFNPFANAAASGRKRPNVVVVISDQMRADALACSGNTFTVTPNMDRLARGGIRFANAYCPQALCTPSRGALMSGVYPHTSGLDYLVYKVPNTLTDPQVKLRPTWPGILHRAGYYSAYVGKWHLGNDNPGIFDEWYGYNSLVPHWSGKRDHSRYLPDLETPRALRFLEETKKRDQPFLLFLSFYPPHNPYDPPMKDEEIYIKKGAPHPGYYGAVTAVDQRLGQVLDKLKEIGAEEDTFVVFTSDHGDTFGTRPGSKHKTVSTDDSAKVPFLWRWPRKFPAGAVYTGGVSTLDLMPTVLQAAGLPVPDRVQGRSLLLDIREKQFGWKGPVFMENITQLKIDGSYAVERAVRTEKWKLILRDHPGDELYNLVHDPDERKNLISEAVWKPKIQELAWLLEGWGRNTEDLVAIKYANRYA